MIAHEDILTLFKQRPLIGLAIWRKTLIDAAIFREAITNNSTRPRAPEWLISFANCIAGRAAPGLEKIGTLHLPLHQAQLGDALGMSLVTVNRTLQALCRTGAMEFRNGELSVRDWKRLADIGEFDQTYLHRRAPPRL